jgi:hypothetical protein
MADDFMLAYSEELNQAALRPRPGAQSAPIKLELTVLHTGLSGTLGALRKAADLASGLNAHIRLLVPQVVPYPLSLESPPVLLEFNQRRFQAIAAAQAVETRVEIFLCRDVDALLAEVLPHGSTILIGARKRWWRTAEQRLARRLHRMGHHTILATGFVSEEDHDHA